MLVNMGERKVTICWKDLDTIKLSGKYSCSVCRKGVGRNSIFVQVVMYGFIRSKEEQNAGLLPYQILSATNFEV